MTTSFFSFLLRQFCRIKTRIVEHGNEAMNITICFLIKLILARSLLYQIHRFRIFASEIQDSAFLKKDMGSVGCLLSGAGLPQFQNGYEKEQET